MLPEASTRVAAIEAGRVDIAVQLPFREAVRLEKNAQLKVKMYPQAEIYMLQIPSYVDTYQNKDVRTALAHGDRQGGARQGVLQQRRQAAAGAGDAGLEPATCRAIPSRSTARRPPRRSQKAGFSKAKPLQMTFCTTNGTFPNDYEMAQAIAAMWRQIGVDVKLEEMTVAKYLELNHAAKLPGIMLYSWANATGDPENYSGRILNPALRFSAWKEPANGERIAKLFAMKLGERAACGLSRAQQGCVGEFLEHSAAAAGRQHGHQEDRVDPDLFAGLCPAGRSEADGVKADSGGRCLRPARPREGGDPDPKHLIPAFAGMSGALRLRSALGQPACSSL